MPNFERVAPDAAEGPPSASTLPHDDMLAEPSDARIFNRPAVEYVQKDERFSLQNKLYGQFFQLYFQRLMLTAPKLKESVAGLWPGVPAAKILELDEDVDCVLIGTLYKEMRLKPSILDEYTKDMGAVQKGVATQVSATKLVSEDDAVVLEDEGARVLLKGDVLRPASLSSGLVLAVRGRAIAGDFVVSGVCFPSPAPQKALAPAPPSGQRYLALVSGLDLGQADPLPVQLMADYLSGNLGGAQELELSSSVVHLVVCGCVLGKLDAPAAPVEPKAASRLAGPLKEADVLLTQLAASIPVDVMPGPGDPSNQALPQQPMHSCLMPSAARYSTLRQCTNPHDFEVAGVHCLGTSGQNVEDLYRYTDVESRGDIMEATLRWGHIAPSAPDTLSCYPFHDRDPFIVAEMPHVYFAGNQPSFETRLLKGPSGQLSRVVAVPSFATTGTMVLVNLSTLACHPIVFSTAPMTTSS